MLSKYSDYYWWHIRGVMRDTTRSDDSHTLWGHQGGLYYYPSLRTQARHPARKQNPELRYSVLVLLSSFQCMSELLHFKAVLQQVKQKHAVKPVSYDIFFRHVSCQSSTPKYSYLISFGWLLGRRDSPAGLHRKMRVDYSSGRMGVTYYVRVHVTTIY